MNLPIKPTGLDAVVYLEQRAPDRKWSFNDTVVLEEYDNHGPVQVAFLDELHWMGPGVVGARGFPLWNFDIELPAKRSKRK